MTRAEETDTMIENMTAQAYPLEAWTDDEHRVVVIGWIPDGDAVGGQFVPVVVELDAPVACAYVPAGPLDVQHPNGSGTSSRGR